MNAPQSKTAPESPRLFAGPRREFLYAGLLGGLGLTLPQFLRMEAAAAASGGPAAKAKSVIHIFLQGGIAHHESFDPKPNATADYRGPFGSVSTSVPGVHFGEMFRHTARVADKTAVIRSMTHGEAAHERGVHNMFTGYRPSPAINYPSMGAVVSHELGGRNDLPPYVIVPNAVEHSGTGYLSSAYGPFGLGSDPARSDFTVRDLNLPRGLSEERFNRRRSLLQTVDSHFRSMESSDALDAMDEFYQRAYGMISSPEARAAFDLDQESAKLRDEYGRNQAGQRFLLARRLVESGVRFVSVLYGGWDHHNNIHAGFRNLAPNLDQALARLIRDLDDRGMLDETLVLVSSEFGRTPRINSSNGRDHWPRVFSVMLAGGGVQGGAIYGASDALGADVDSNPVSPEDLAKTVYHQLGIDATKRLMASGDRPIDIVNGGRVVHEVLG